MDGNGALTAGMAEALLQSHAGHVHLLPCLPEAWQTGAFRGLRARGGLVIDARWTPKALDATLTANRDTSVEIRLGQQVVHLDLEKGRPHELTLRRQ